MQMILLIWWEAAAILHYYSIKWAHPGQPLTCDWWWKGEREIPILNPRYSILNSQYTILNIQSSILEKKTKIICSVGNQFKGGVTWFQVCPPGGVSCISSNFGHQVALLAVVENLASRWHYLYSCKCGQQFVLLAPSGLHLFQIRPPDGATCISYKFYHHMAHFALVAKLSTRWRHLH